MFLRTFILTLLCLFALSTETFAQRRIPRRRAARRPRPTAPVLPAPAATPQNTATDTAGNEPTDAATANAANATDTTTAMPVLVDADQLFAALPQLPAAERVATLEILARSNDAKIKDRARLMLVVARAAFADERLVAGDAVAGVEQFRRALAESPDPLPERLFLEVVARFPASLYLRGERTAALEIARLIEERAAGNHTRLLALAAFHLSIENPEDALRLAALAVALAPTDPTPHLTLGAAERTRLNLNSALTHYRRASELASDNAVARRSFADLLRAAGQSAEALALYQSQLERDPADALAHSGVILSLFDIGNRAEAERQLDSLLASAKPDDPATQPPLPLLVGVSYAYSIAGAGARALDFANRAVAVEPRYTWAQIARARALMLERRPAEAEAALRTAAAYGSFPTLSYELAAALHASGFYTEAAEALARSFTVTAENQLAANLAARIPSQAANFTHLLAPERRAAILQSRSASPATEAEQLRRLLIFDNALRLSNATPEELAARAADFAAGADQMRFFRSLYAAERLLEHPLRAAQINDRVLALVRDATEDLDRALDQLSAATATLADDLSDVRRRALASGTTLPAPPAVERRKLSDILRGRMEIAAGRALSNASQHEAAAVRLQRATTILPADTDWRRAALYHLGTSLEAQNKKPEALDAYLRAYDTTRPNRLRLLLIETLYRQINGSLDGLEERLGK